MGFKLKKILTLSENNFIVGYIWSQQQNVVVLFSFHLSTHGLEGFNSDFDYHFKFLVLV